MNLLKDSSLEKVSESKREPNTSYVLNYEEQLVQSPGFLKFHTEKSSLSSSRHFFLIFFHSLIETFLDNFCIKRENTILIKVEKKDSEKSDKVGVAFTSFMVEDHFVLQKLDNCRF